MTLADTPPQSDNNHFFLKPSLTESTRNLNLIARTQLALKDYTVQLTILFVRGEASGYLIEGE